MDESAKNKINALELLQKSAMQRYAWRAQVEWKLCLALWAALAAFSGAVLTGKQATPPTTLVVVSVGVVAFAICALHLSWLRGLWRTQRLDNNVSFFFRDRMMEAVGLHFSSDISNEIDKIKKGNNQELEVVHTNASSNMRRWRHEFATVLKHWSHGFQFGITFLLACGAVGAVFWAAHHHN